MIKGIVVCLFFCSAALGQQTRSEKDVWQAEESYWKSMHDNQKTAYLALWDERFVGWPRFEANPISKAATSFTPVSEYKLVPLSVR